MNNQKTVKFELIKLATSLRSQSVIHAVGQIQLYMYQYLEERYGDPENASEEILQFSAVIQGILDTMSETANEKMPELPQLHLGGLYVEVPESAIVWEKTDEAH